MKKQSGGSVQVVHVDDEEGELVEFSTQAEVHEAIWSNIHRRRFYLAEEALICSYPLIPSEKSSDTTLKVTAVKRF